jgi:4-diphosphocytidyl-2-C-methyl-D-erythritol kinase
LQVFPAPAKLNLFLHITGRRADGYHLLQTMFRLLDFGDDLLISTNTSGRIQRAQPIPGVSEEQDITLRAAKLLQQATGCTLGADIAVEKRIPMGGGLGGGSSDAATVLLALNHLWRLGLSRSRLMELGLQLGADVPIFVFGQNAWGEGVGEKLQAIDLPEAWYVVLTPAVHVSTAAIFSSNDLTRDTIPRKMAAFSKGFGQNDMQPLVCRIYPEVAKWLGWLGQFGDARMSGSGSSVFVELASQEAAETVMNSKPAEVSGFVARGLAQHPLYGYATS